MESGASTRRRGKSGRGYGHGGEDRPGTIANETHANQPVEGPPVPQETRALIAAALIGAAIGAGLGLLASRSIDDDDVSAMFRSARKRARHGLRRGRAAAQAIGERAGEAADAVGDFASSARSAFDDVLEREVRQLRKAARRQRRRLGL